VMSEGERKIKVNEPDQFGDTPLHIAAAAGKLLEVKFLVNNGANVNAKNNAGSTPLHKAVLGGSRKIVEFLITDHEAEWVANDSGFTPFTYARDILRDNKQFFFNLLSKETNNVAKETIIIPSHALPIIIGKGGKMLETLRATTQTDVEVPNKPKNSDEATEEVELHLTAKSKEDIEGAKKKIEELILKKLEDEKSKQKKGAPDQVEEFKKKEVKKRPEAKPDQKNLINDIVKDIALNQAQSDTKKELIVSVPKDKHGYIVGKDRANINRIEQTYGVTVHIPPKNDPKAKIILRGTNKESLDEAKYDIIQTLQGRGRGRGTGGPRRESGGDRYRRDQEETDPKPVVVKQKKQQPLNLNDANEWPAFG